ncbi:hypothetical protein GDO86_003909 [Hymenochirus boettgeri]|uniref:Uncharacterized protein n=1 Tax=Hymenochirus boettgeri TaxID=247094 RepID=A0A8T2K333_9PIPI|nr:hypothetical protein GDO86_003909 [Hymenochirus boettgeri]
MLSEGYLYGIQYCYEDGTSMFPSKRAADLAKELSSVNNLPYPTAYETRTRGFFKKKIQGNCDSLVFERKMSSSLEITDYSASNKETYLVPSSCKEICKDYNDLHIAGDQVMAMNTELSDLTCTSSFEFCEGPFLESSQIPPNMESINAAANDMVKKPIKGDSTCWKTVSIKDKSIMQHQQPLSNSVLNEYLERKVVELYKQYIMEISCSTSPNIIASELLMNNVQLISLQISREQNLETNKAKDMVISFLRRLASEKQSNILSTPDLQISSDGV